MAYEKMNVVYFPPFPLNLIRTAKRQKRPKILQTFCKLTKNRCVSVTRSAPIYVMTDKKGTDPLEVGLLYSADDVDQELARDFGSGMDIKD